ncbi:MAG: cation:proton antiporter [Tissierellia bacterium]|nr:cation:proton antiporter [Tissierellia bacterium]
MLLSIAFVLIFGMFSGWVCKKLNLPSLLGMIITGILIGPHIFNLLDDSILNISSELRRIALIIILMRAGLSLDLNDLKKVGRPAILMCFLPATVEIIGMVVLAPKLLGISVIDAAIMGSVVAAVSPAVIVPKMLKLMEEGYGKENSIPQLILAGASVDDVFVIVLFSVFTSLAQGASVSIKSFIDIPVSIGLGIGVGIIIGIILNQFFMKMRMRDTSKTVILLSIAFILVTIEDKFNIPFSALISVMTIGITIQKQREMLATRLASKFNKLWVPAEVILFVLVGASVDIKYALSAGVAAIVLILGVMVFRMAGVYLSLLKTHLSTKERIFCMIAYTPKATVQAAIGGVPLQMGLACGNIVLTVAVLAILITAPLGAFFVDLSYKKLLK